MSVTLKMADKVWNRSKPEVAFSAWKRSGTKSVAIAISKYVPICSVFLGYNTGAKFQLLCFSSYRYITDFVFYTNYYQNLWHHKLSNLHNTKAWISLERKKV